MRGRVRRGRRYKYVYATSVPAGAAVYTIIRVPFRRTATSAVAVAGATAARGGGAIPRLRAKVKREGRKLEEGWRSSGRADERRNE